MPMPMLQCKSCGEVFPGLYVPEGSTEDFKTNATNANTSHIYSRKHTKNTFQQIIWIGLNIHWRI
jgi:hypothetical protein